MPALFTILGWNLLMCLCRLLAVFASVHLLQIVQNIPAGLSRPLNLLIMASSSDSDEDSPPSFEF